MPLDRTEITVSDCMYAAYGAAARGDLQEYFGWVALVERELSGHMCLSGGQPITLDRARMN